MLISQARDGYLLLEDGVRFEGRRAGADASATGEVVFTTNLTGYHEVLTDPSYAGQIVVMTAPMIGNYGIFADDAQSRRPWVSGFVLRRLSPPSDEGRWDRSLEDYLIEGGITTLVDVDTRAITRHIRESGAMRGVIAPVDLPVERARERLLSEPPMRGRDLATEVSTPEIYELEAEGPGRGEVVCVDYGVKRRSLELIRRAGYRVRVVPGGTSPGEILSESPDGIFISNGPGDPEAVSGADDRIRALCQAETPLFGICLGHQLIARAFGGRNEKLPYGHRGGNHPVRNLESGEIEITSQNHGFAVTAAEDGVAGAPDLRVTHRNLNDGTIEGLVHRELPVFAVQYHPESAPGPHDSRYLFDAFVGAMTGRTAGVSR